MADYTSTGGFSKEDRVLEWELGLPNDSDLVPLSQSLIPPQLASAFSITPEPYRTNLDVTRAAQKTISSIKGHYQDNNINGNNFKSFDDMDGADGECSDSRKSQRIGDEPVTKRVRLVWTPQLHKRFVDVVRYLGIENAVPKTVMEMMNVEGLTRENVASHLQKYRLYLKRTQR